MERIRRIQVTAALITAVIILTTMPVLAGERDALRDLPSGGRVVIDDTIITIGDPAVTPSPGERWHGYDIPMSIPTEQGVQPSLAHDELGAIYCAYRNDAGNEIRILSSDDGGATWGGVVNISSGVATLKNPSLTLARGAENWLLMAYVHDETEIRILRTNLDNYSDSSISVVSDTAGGKGWPRIVTDGLEYSAWYGYVIFNANAPDGWLLAFSRTTDYGATWSWPSDYLYFYCGVGSGGWYEGSTGQPDIAFGNGVLQVVFDDIGPCSGTDYDLWTTASTNYGSDWSAPAALVAGADVERDPTIAAMDSGSGAAGMVVAYTETASFDSDIRGIASSDGGSSWGSPFDLATSSLDSEKRARLGVEPGGNRFHLVYQRLDGDTGAAHIDYEYADYPALSTWTEREAVNYGGTALHYSDTRPDVAAIPGADPDLAAVMVWSDYRDGYSRVYCDGPGAVALGTIIVDTNPDSLETMWELYGPDGYYYLSVLDETLTDMPVGDYTIFWYPVDDWAEPDPIAFGLLEGEVETIVGTYLSIPPQIYELVDQPNDQGRQVRMSWEPALHDPASVNGYTVYRKQESGREGGGHRAGDRLEGWDGLVWLPAHGDASYHYVAPTLCDSTDAGICWSVFMVRATTLDPLIFWDSSENWGYSVDNLHPDAPGGLAMPASNLLAWDPCPDHDFDYFTVYVDDDENFDSPTLVGYTTDTSLDVSGTSGSWLAVSATDENGNESELSTILYNSTNAGELPPAAFALRQNVPNPFNPSTSIGFELPKPAAVTLTIFDLAGREVRMLAERELFVAGRHALSWDGRDGAGTMLSTGIYLYRIEAGGQRAIRKMTLLK
jgi:hypothetical protein